MCDIMEYRGDEMIRIAIVDDEKIILNSIHKKIEKILYDLNVEFEIQDFTIGKIALKEITEKEFDIIFLDIDMPEVSGMEIAKIIRMQEENIDIVFITNKDELVYDAIKFAPFRFIRKSRFDEEIPEALQDNPLLNDVAIKGTARKKALYAITYGLESLLSKINFFSSKF